MSSSSTVITERTLKTNWRTIRNILGNIISQDRALRTRAHIRRAPARLEQELGSPGAEQTEPATEQIKTSASLNKRNSRPSIEPSLSRARQTDRQTDRQSCHKTRPSVHHTSLAQINRHASGQEFSRDCVRNIAYHHHYRVCTLSVPRSAVISALTLLSVLYSLPDTGTGGINSLGYSISATFPWPTYTSQCRERERERIIIMRPSHIYLLKPIVASSVQRARGGGIRTLSVFRK